jgi:hypothetical protein
MDLSYFFSIYFLNLALLLVAGELPSITEESIYFARALLFTAREFLSIVVCAITFKFL